MILKSSNDFQDFKWFSGLHLIFRTSNDFQDFKPFPGLQMIFSTLRTQTTWRTLIWKPWSKYWLVFYVPYSLGCGCWSRVSGWQVRVYLTQCVDWMVLESQTPHKTVDLLFKSVIHVVSNNLTILWEGWLSKPLNYDILRGVCASAAGQPDKWVWGLRGLHFLSAAHRD